MKKLISIIIISLMIVSLASADSVDLSQYSYEDLLLLNKKVEMEIMSRPEWKEVRVPAGFWTVGEDIPAGKYSFEKDYEYSGHINVWGLKVGDYSHNGGLIVNMPVYGEGEIVGKIELKTGNVLDLGCAFIVRPAMSLGF